MSRSLLALAAVTLAALLAVLLVQGGGETDGAGQKPGQRLLPELSGRIKDVTLLRIVGPGNATAVTLRRTGDTWSVDERAAYAADAAKLRRLVTDLAGLEVTEAKTSDPALYARLGVEDPALPGAQGLRLEIEGLASPLRVIVGRAAASGGTYLRRDGDPQSVEARPPITVDVDPALWLDRRLVALDGRRVQSVAVTPANGRRYSIERSAASEANFRLVGIPATRQAYNAAAANPQAQALAAFDVDDVRALGASGFPAAAGTLVYRTFDGLVLTIDAAREADKAWLRVSASVDSTLNPPATVRAEGDALSRRTGGYAFAIPAYRLDTLIRPLEDFLGP